MLPPPASFAAFSSSSNESASNNTANPTQLVNEYKIKPIELESSIFLARKLSGRDMMMKKRLESEESIAPSKASNSKTTSNSKNKTAASNSFNTQEETSSYAQSNTLVTASYQTHCFVTTGSNDLSNERNKSKFCSICLASFDASEPELNLVEPRLNQNQTVKAAAEHEESSKFIDLNAINSVEDGDDDDDETDGTNQLVQVLCGHKFCKQCWERYLTMKIEEGNVIDIVCPQVDCFIIVPHDVVKRLVSKPIALKYLQFDLKAFVDSNPSLKWCPFPGCGMAVRHPSTTTAAAASSKLLSDNDNREVDALKRVDLLGMEQQLSCEYSKAVDCGAGHYFCWDCLDEGHSPATCKNWKDWFEKVKQVKPEECNDTVFFFKGFHWIRF